MTNLLIRYIPYIFDIFLLLLLLLLLLRLLARCLCGVHLKFWLRLGMASLSFQTISHIRAATHISNATTTKLYAFRFQDMFSVHRSMRKKILTVLSLFTPSRVEKKMMCQSAPKPWHQSIHNRKINLMDEIFTTTHPLRQHHSPSHTQNAVLPWLGHTKKESLLNDRSGLCPSDTWIWQTKYLIVFTQRFK